MEQPGIEPIYNLLNKMASEADADEVTLSFRYKDSTIEVSLTRNE